MLSVPLIMEKVYRNKVGPALEAHPLYKLPLTRGIAIKAAGRKLLGTFGGAVRFFHMALFEGHLLSLHYYLVDTAFCLAFGFWGYRATRAGQMAEQYGWLYRRAGPLSWAKKRPAPNAAAPESG